MKAVLAPALAISLLILAGCISSPDRDSQTHGQAPPLTSTREPEPEIARPTAAPTEEVLAPLPTKSPRPTQIAPTEAPVDITAVSTIDLKVRNGPGTNYPQIGVLKKGTQVVLWGISQDRAWFQHERGWSAVAYMTTEAETSGLPVVLAEPPPEATEVPAQVIAPTPLPQPVAPPPTVVIQAPPPTAVPPPPPPSNCHASYPTVCIPPPPPDLDCGQIAFRRFAVVGSDPHRFDGDGDGVGCESG